MYRMLIVDDEIHAVNGIKAGINWEALGVSDIYTAYNIRQAKEVYNNNKVDMMICDIEMPQGNGLELLEWVREHHESTISVLLTCHSDFEYAKKAIHLGSLDYLLKPVRFSELEEVIRKAIDKIEKNKKLTDGNTYEQYYKLWSINRPLLIERFWLDLLNRLTPSDNNSIEDILAKTDIPYNEGMLFVPLLIRVQRWHKKITLREERIMENELRTLADKLLKKEDRLEQMIQPKRGLLLAVLSINDQMVLNKCKLKKECLAYINSCNSNYYCDVSCYIGTAGHVHEIPDIYEALVNYDSNNVASYNKVFFLDEKTRVPGQILLPSMNGWTEMLMQGKRERLLAELDSSIEELSRQEGLDAAALYEFYHDFMQIVYYVLKQKDLPAHRIFLQGEPSYGEGAPPRSVYELHEQLRNTVNKVSDYIYEVENFQSTVEKVKSYVLHHIGDGLTREDIASYFYINPDYLTRIFKKQTGLSISDYLIQERMRIAKDLLINTNMSIKEIVSYIGYMNFSHFSKVFKKTTNLNPLAFRKSNQQNI